MRDDIPWGKKKRYCAGLVHQAIFPLRMRKMVWERDYKECTNFFTLSNLLSLWSDSRDSSMLSVLHVHVRV